MRTTVDINDALLKELRERAVESGVSFKRILEQTLASGLANHPTLIKTRKFKVRPHALGVKPGFRGMSMNQLYDQLEAEESAR